MITNIIVRLIGANLSILQKRRGLKLEKLLSYRYKQKSEKAKLIIDINEFEKRYP